MSHGAGELHAGIDGDIEAALRSYGRLTALARDSGNEYHLTNAYVCLTLGFALFGMESEGTKYADAAERAALRIQNPTSVAWAHYAQALVRAVPSPDAAVEFLREAGTVARSVSNTWIEMMARSLRAGADRRLGHLDRAAEALKETIEVWSRAKMSSQLGHDLELAGLLLAEAGAGRAATQAISTARRVGRGYRMMPDETAAIEAIVEPHDAPRPDTDDAVQATLAALTAIVG